MKQKTPAERATEYYEYFNSCTSLEQLRGTASALELLIKKLPDKDQDWLRDSYTTVKENIETHERNKDKS